MKKDFILYNEKKDVSILTKTSKSINNINQSIYWSNSIQQKETTQEAFNEKLIQKVTEIREEIDKTQSRFTQELHRFTIDLSKLIEKWFFFFQFFNSIYSRVLVFIFFLLLL